MRGLKNIWVIVSLCVLAACAESFELPRANELRALVVDGRITDQDDFYTIRLSNTKLINGDSIPRLESGATVVIEEENGPSILLPHVGGGVYTASSSSLPAKIGTRYRLNITLLNGLDYQSSWELMRPTPEIQSVDMGFVTKGGEGGLQLFLNTTDETGETSFFRWEVIETWKYKVPYASRLLLGNPQLKPEEDFHETCWITRSKKNIMLSTVNNQSESAVVNHPLVFVSSDSAKLNVRYSAQVKQYAIGLDEFSFWKGLRDTNEGVGGLYDSQPFQVVSNVRSLSDSEEVVFGYFSVNAVQEKRIFIDREDFPEDFLPQKTFSDCPLIDLSLATPEVQFFYLSNGIYLYVYGSNFTTPPCGDCEAYGGTTMKPNYWEE